MLPQSVPAKALALAEATGTVLYSEVTLDELARVLQRPKIASYMKSGTVEGFINRIRRDWLEVVTTHTIRACRDPKDDKFLELAVNGRADVLVSGDADPLVLHPFRGIPIVDPATFGRAQVG